MLLQLRAIKERWNEDGTPAIDPQSGPARKQLVNGGQIRILDPKTRIPRSILPGESFELPDKEARDLLKNAPQSVELESQHQARQALFKQRERARDDEREALDARQRELEAQVAQQQKLRAMAEDRERLLAAENLRTAQKAQGTEALLSEARQRAEAEEQERLRQQALARQHETSLLEQFEKKLAEMKAAAEAQVAKVQQAAQAELAKAQKVIRDLENKLSQTPPGGVTPPATPKTPAEPPPPPTEPHEGGQAPEAPKPEGRNAKAAPKASTAEAPKRGGT